jgi:hypothetical protein
MHKSERDKNRHQTYYQEHKEYFREYAKKHSLKLYLGKIKRQYGLSAESYFKLLEHQKSKCAVCRKKPSSRLHVDHDHKTGKIRGLLCSGCNFTLGQMKDKTKHLQSLITYIQYWR